MLIVRCPKCGRDQRTDPRIKSGEDLTNKVKRCVYCGHSFKIHSSLPKSRIVKEEFISRNEQNILTHILDESEKKEFFATEKELLDRFKKTNE
jgi:hypothetical protein